MQAALTSTLMTVLDGNNLVTAPKVDTWIGCQGTVQRPAENAVSVRLVLGVLEGVEWHFEFA